MLPKVLLVDDVDFFLEMEKDYLRGFNVEILTAKNGQQALEIARRERPHIIFMDVIMPFMDGLTCCRSLKSDPRLHAIPVIMVFAGSREVTPEACMKAGCDGTLSKPVEKEKFLDLGASS